MTCLHLSFTLHDLCLFVLYTLWLAFACPFFHSITYLCLPHPLHILSMTYLYLSFNTSWLTFACPFFTPYLPLALSSTPWLNGACVIHSMTYLYLSFYISRLIFSFLLDFMTYFYLSFYISRLIFAFILDFMTYLCLSFPLLCILHGFLDLMNPLQTVQTFIQQESGVIHQHVDKLHKLLPIAIKFKIKYSIPFWQWHICEILKSDNKK